MKQRQPETLLPFLFRALVDGIIVGWSLMLGVLYFDVSNIQTMIMGSEDGNLLVFILACVFAITFGSVGMGIAIFTIPNDDEPPT
jgi:hypothetical protein